MEQDHGCPEVPRFPVQAWHAPLARFADRKQLATDPTTGETHIRHHVTADGYYRGKKVIETKSAVADED